MQTIEKANNTGESATEAYLKNFNFQAGTLRRPLCLFMVALATSLVLTTGSVRAENATQPSAPAGSALENTERNVRDSGNTTLTPQDQKETHGDRELTAAIRRAIIKDKSLSLNAHNAKIITRNGVVTLRGPVENSAEKIKLESIAQGKRGVTQVDNQLEPKTP